MEFTELKSIPARQLRALSPATGSHVTAPVVKHGVQVPDFAQNPSAQLAQSPVVAARAKPATHESVVPRTGSHVSAVVDLQGTQTPFTT